MLIHSHIWGFFFFFFMLVPHFNSSLRWNWYYLLSASLGKMSADPCWSLVSGCCQRLASSLLTSLLGHEDGWDDISFPPDRFDQDLWIFSFVKGQFFTIFFGYEKIGKGENTSGFNVSPFTMFVLLKWFGIVISTTPSFLHRFPTFCMSKIALQIGCQMSPAVERPVEQTIPFLIYLGKIMFKAVKD